MPGKRIREARAAQPVHAFDGNLTREVIRRIAAARFWSSGTPKRKRTMFVASVQVAGAVWADVHVMDSQYVIN